MKLLRSEVWVSMNISSAPQFRTLPRLSTLFPASVNSGPQKDVSPNRGTYGNNTKGWHEASSLERGGYPGLLGGLGWWQRVLREVRGSEQEA